MRRGLRRGGRLGRGRRCAGAGCAAEARERGHGGREAVQRVDGCDEVCGGVEGFVCCGPGAGGFAVGRLRGAAGGGEGGAFAAAGRTAGAVSAAVAGWAAAGEEFEGAGGGGWFLVGGGGFAGEGVVGGRGAAGEGDAGRVLVFGRRGGRGRDELAGFLEGFGQGGVVVGDLVFEAAEEGGEAVLERAVDAVVDFVGCLEQVLAAGFEAVGLGLYHAAQTAVGGAGSGGTGAYGR